LRIYGNEITHQSEVDQGDDANPSTMPDNGLKTDGPSTVQFAKCAHCSAQDDNRLGMWKCEVLRREGESSAAGAIALPAKTVVDAG